MPSSSLLWIFSLAISGAWNPASLAYHMVGFFSFQLKCHLLIDASVVVHLTFIHPSFGKNIPLFLRTHFSSGVLLFTPFSACGLGGMNSMPSSRCGSDWHEPINIFHYSGHGWDCNPIRTKEMWGDIYQGFWERKVPFYSLRTFRRDLFLSLHSG